ncbi:hypothetical protein ACJ73_07920 [Blastomyces percursus]|uniref:BCS1 N-terminal domain-containing protein n=1 Tax=Blastomyces percursus TaxID=1658174 RepID=A0A1J9PWL6_9EURO|nr:hypothetical protein ACJ73_07920 [Blastomyces percursus]
MTHHSANSSGTPPTMPRSETSVLDVFLPGYSFFSWLFSFYFNVDISLYLLLIVVSVAVGNSPRLHDIVKHLFTSTLEITYDDEAYRFILFWMAKHEDGDGSHIDETDLQEDIDFEDYWPRTIRNDKSRKPHYTPGAGTHYFRYKGHWVSLRRTPYAKDTGVPWLLNAENITLACFGRNPKILKEVLEEARHSFLEREDDRIVIYSGLKAGDSFQWVRNTPKTPRPFSTVVLDRNEKSRLLEDIREYLHPRTRFWYHTHGIPYQRGYLFSACEDIDCVDISQNRRDSPTAPGQQGLSLSAFLNAIDGVAAAEGRLFMVTTNYPEKLDPALTRPGRIDIKIVFHYANRAVIQELFRSMYTASNSRTHLTLAEICATLTKPNNDDDNNDDDDDNDDKITAIAENLRNAFPKTSSLLRKSRDIFYNIRKALKMQLKA